MRTKVDYIIVGQGLGGSCLALQLLTQQKKVRVIDEPSGNICSVVAAGLFNPITGKFMKKSWMAEKLFPYLLQFYKEAEERLNAKLIFEKPIYRPFESIEEQNDWMTRGETSSVKNFIKEIFVSPQWPHQVQNPFGGLLINHSGYVDVNSFLTSTRKYLTSRNEFLSKRFDHANLQISGSEIIYQDIEAEKIIFCEGASVNENPFFKWVPIRPMKGEVITIELAETPAVIFNRGVYIVPAENSRYNVGATYQHPPFERQITETGRQELNEKLEGLLNMPYRGVDQRWGVRPASTDRRPMMGKHPRFANVIVFNGLGTKGVSLAPYFSNQLADWMSGKYEIMTEVNIERFYPLYSRSS